MVEPVLLPLEDELTMPKHDLSSALGQEMLSAADTAQFRHRLCFVYTDSVKSELPQIEQ